MWSKVKEFLRTLQVRTENALFEAIGTALCHVTADDALGWFHSCGYTDKQEKCTQNQSPPAKPVVWFCEPLKAVVVEQTN